MSSEPVPAASAEVETVFHVPRLNQASVVAGACCPVPAEAILLPELEMVPGVSTASADWQAAEVRVVHAATVAPATLAAVLADLDYPATSYGQTSRPLSAVSGEPLPIADSR